MNPLAELLSSRVRADVFRLLFGMDGSELHMREIERRSGLAYATIRQELTSLSRLGLVNVRRSGNRVYYRANTAHPLYPEIRSLVLKTSGLPAILRERLSHPGIQIAFVFGSIARGTEKPDSDIDLMVIGSIGLRQISKLLSGLGVTLRREVNPHLMTVEEFTRRKRARDHFLMTVLREPKMFVIGSENELETMGERRLVASS
jgi:predicted nucleotidyltransferase